MMEKIFTSQDSSDKKLHTMSVSCQLYFSRIQKTTYFADLANFYKKNKDDRDIAISNGEKCVF